MKDIDRIISVKKPALPCMTWPKKRWQMLTAALAAIPVVSSVMTAEDVKAQGSAAAVSVTQERCQFGPDYATASGYACVARNFDRYLGEAENGADAPAKALYHALAGCEENTLSKYRSAASSATLEGDQGSHGTIRWVNRQLNRCSYFSPEQIAKFTEISNLPANLDADEPTRLRNALLRVSWTVAQNPDDPANRGLVDGLVTDLKQKADAQHPEVLLMLGQIYSDGKLIPKDLLPAYGYIAAAVVAEPADDASREKYLVQLLDSIGEKMLPEDRERAVDLASATIPGIVHDDIRKVAGVIK